MPDMPKNYYFWREIVAKILSRTSDYQLARSIWSVEFSSIDIKEHDVIRFIETLKQRKLLSDEFSLMEYVLDENRA